VTEKTKTLNLGCSEGVGSWSDIESLYRDEETHILRATQLTNAAVRPTNTQKQSVPLLLKVFNEKTIAALKTRRGVKAGTIANLELGLEWWKRTHVTSITDAERFNDRARLAITSNQCEPILRLRQIGEQIHKLPSGIGEYRVHMLTPDTKRTLWLTSMGLADLAEHLMERWGFEYVLTAELDSDRLEAEFAVMRGTTGSNQFMTVADVTYCIAGRNLSILAKLDAMEAVITTAEDRHIDCDQCAEIEDTRLDTLAEGVDRLTDLDRYACIYVAGWLFRTTPDFDTTDEDPVACDMAFTDELSRGKLMRPPQSLAYWTMLGLVWFISNHKAVTCHTFAARSLLSIGSAYLDREPTMALANRLAHVLMNGVQKMTADCCEKAGRKRPTAGSSSSSTRKLSRISGN
jgi:hypothetical protein